MRKYWQIFVNYFQERLEYRLNIFWRIAGTLIWTPVLFALWATVINAGFGADKYTFNSLAVYYISVSFISLFTNFDQNALAMEIRRGELASDLLKPYGYFQKFFLRFLPEKILLFGIYIPIFLVMGFNGNLFLAFFSSCLAVFIAFYIALSIGSLAFWFKRTYGFNALLFSVGGLFSGSAIPLDLLPKNLMTLANYLPFKYMIFVPAQLISTKLDLINVLKIFGIQLGWIIILAFITRVIWTKGIREFDSSGG